MSELEGVVKYSLDFSEEALHIETSYKKLESLRQRIYALGLIGVYDNGIGYGNLSLRDEYASGFIITATGTGALKKLNSYDYSQVLKIDFDSFKTFAKGTRRPSSECITHGAIYELDANIHVIIHIHNRKLWDFMLQNGNLSTNDTPYGTKQMVVDIQNMYKNIVVLDHNLFVMKGHEDGIICFGRNIEEAEITLYELLKKALF